MKDHFSSGAIPSDIAGERLVVLDGTRAASVLDRRQLTFDALDVKAQAIDRRVGLQRQADAVLDFDGGSQRLAY